MGRKTKHKIGDLFGGLEIREIIPATKTGNHVRLNCLCHYCNNHTIINGGLIHKFRSCGCQQRNSNTWKNKTGAKNKPHQLPKGKAARNLVEYGYIRGAKKRNIEYNLTTEEFDNIIQGSCYYCGDKLTNCKKGTGKTSGDFQYTGIDRIDSSLGYTKNNCVSCCWKCNSMKNNSTIVDFLTHIRKIYQHNKQ